MLNRRTSNHAGTCVLRQVGTSILPGKQGFEKYNSHLAVAASKAASGQGGQALGCEVVKVTSGEGCHGLSIKRGKVRQHLCEKSSGRGTEQESTGPGNGNPEAQ